MALVDSEAAFEQRTKEVVTNQAARLAILNRGIRSFSMLAFSVGTPQTPTDDAFRTFADQVLPPGYDMGTYKRLHFKASTFVSPN